MLRLRFKPKAYTPPDPASRPLTNRSARTGTTIHGWPAIILGLPFVAVGAALVAFGLGYIAPVDFDIKVDGVPTWLPAAIGSVFGYAGLSVLVHGVIGVVRRHRVARLLRSYPNEPWLWDHQWDPRGVSDDTLTRARHFFTVAIFIFVFLTPFHWIGFFAPKPVLPFGIVALLFDAIAVGIFIAAIYFVARRIKYGPSRALYATFPYRRGTTMEMHVTAPRALPQHAVVSATLRCVQERYVTTGRGEDRTTNVQCFEIYRDTAPAELMAAGAGPSALRVRFDIPKDAPVTDLFSRPCRYWEVDVEAVTDGVDYGARFLVPVY